MTGDIKEKIARKEAEGGGGYATEGFVLFLLSTGSCVFSRSTPKPVRGFLSSPPSRPPVPPPCSSENLLVDRGSLS